MNVAKAIEVKILPIGEIDKNILIFLKENLVFYFEELNFSIGQNIQIPKNCFNSKRAQFKGSCILEEIENLNNENKIILAIIDKDLYEEPLNFVFGIANNRIALISITRLKDKFYGLKEENNFYQRVLKEANHELGHTFGLEHCSNPICVMYFSNSILDTDKKGPDFCKICRKKLKIFISKIKNGNY